MRGINDLKATLTFLVTLIASLGIAWTGGAADLTFEDRVTYRRLIEDVYWQHRSWPEGNTKAKPPLSEVLPEEILRERVEDSLRLSRALEARWQRPITTEDLQAELDRIVRDTAAPEILEQLFQALGREPQIIAETLVRPLLADRLARVAFASDTEIHAAVRQQAETEYQRFASVGDMRKLTDAYREVSWLRWGDGVAKHELMDEGGDGEPLYLDPAQWEEKTEWLDERVGDIPPGEISDLRESRDHFSALAVLERGDRRIRLAIVVWPKADFDQWWSAARDQQASKTPPQVGGYELKPIKSVTGTPNSWQAIGTAGSPPHARSNHTAIWLGSEMIVWGGDDGVGYVYSGSRYNYITSNWTAMNNTGHPLGRYDHTVVWNGTAMVVWGGERGGPTDTGGRYNPTADTWLSVPTSGAPSARTLHTAVMRDQNMYVWGGWNGSTYLGDGAYYRGASNDWLPISGTGAPSPRNNHTAVMYRSPASGMCSNSTHSMVVYGGQDASGVLGDGAFYCPHSSISWTPLSSAGAPGARVGHTAVATDPTNGYDDLVVVWGGNDGSTDLITGAVWEYNSDFQNQWRPTVLGNVPAPRQGHTAIWTKTGMVAWGGHSGATLHRTGGVYNPFNNVWTPMTTSGAPTARKDHTVVENMGLAYFWGGYDGAPAANGSVYHPPSDFVVECDQRIVTSVPGGVEFFAFEATLYASREYSGDPVTLSNTSFPGNLLIWDNPVTPTGATDVDLFVNAGAGVGDHSFFFEGTSGATTRYFPLTLRVQDFQFSCQPSSVTVAPGGSTNATCTVSSVNAFDDPVALSCSPGTITCSVSPSGVTPPQDGTVDAEVTITVGAGVTPGTYTITPTALSHLAERFSPIEVIVQNGASLIFADGFESGDTSAWVE